MSDGPYRSLPLSKAWREVAKRAHVQAYIIDEGCEALKVALSQDAIREGIFPTIEKIKNILLPKIQTSFFEDNNISANLAKLRLECPGTFSASVIDCLPSSLKNYKGEEAIIKAVEIALRERADAGYRSTEEHYYREAEVPQIKNLQERYTKINKQMDFYSHASGLCNRDKEMASRRIKKRSGLDEGPAL